jgi:hypothetical protein
LHLARRLGRPPRDRTRVVILSTAGTRITAIWLLEDLE